MNIFIATIKDNKAFLTEEESWHCAKVLRKKAGDPVSVIDGEGNFYSGTLQLVSEKSCVAGITEGPVKQPSKNHYLHLAIAPTKQIDRIEWMLEKAVEIGIDEVSFLNCKNSERVVIKEPRIRKIVESAVKQSLQARLPKVNGLVNFDKILNVPCDQKLIAHCGGGEKKDISEIKFSGLKTLVVVGPEGDFSETEVKAAGSAGFSQLSLGDTRLRTETAGLYICQAVSLLSKTGGRSEQ